MLSVLFINSNLNYKMEFLHDRMSVTSSDDDEADYKYAHLMDKKQYEF